MHGRGSESALVSCLLSSSNAKVLVAAKLANFRGNRTALKALLLDEAHKM
jgi:hypothetical protein